MAGSVVLVDRDPLYAWFVTEALLAAGTAVTWFRDAASAVAQAPQMPKDALLLVDGVTWLTASRGAAAAVDTWPRAALIGWDPRTTPRRIREVDRAEDAMSAHDGGPPGVRTIPRR